NLEIAFCLGLGANACSSEVRAAHESDTAVNYEDLGMHPDAVEEFDPRTELTLRVDLLVSLAEGLGGQFGVYYAERNPLIHQRSHQIHEGYESSPVSEAGPFYVCSRDPDETLCTGEMRLGKAFVDVTIKKNFHAMLGFGL